MVGFLMNSELESIRNVAVVAWFKLLSQNFSGGTEKDKENFSQDRLSADRDLNQRPIEYETELPVS
jgi:hypothetical protein